MCNYENKKGLIKMYKFSDNVAWVQEDDEYLLANYNTGKVCIISGTGIDILNCILEEMNLEQIITTLKNKYNDTDDLSMEKDIENFIFDLIRKEYLKNEG